MLQRPILGTTMLVLAPLALMSAAGCKPVSKPPAAKSAESADTGSKVKMVGIKPADNYAVSNAVASAGDGSAGSAAPPAEQSWTFDIDCRPSAKNTADRLFAQYTKTSKDLVDQYNAASAAGTLETRDGGTITAPEGSRVVDVGASGLDHHGQGLVFWDNDAPCYVRVVGGNGEQRLAVAKYLADKLTLETAPMTPRLAM
jgi:hypothetical protein